MEEFERDKKAERERQEERQRRQLRLLEEAIRFDEFAFNDEAAAQKLRLMADVEGVYGTDAIGRYLFDKAAEFYERGDKKGENTALFVAIATYREALKEMTRERVPLDWAMTQMNLGNALTTLGERESGTGKLEEAVAAYREALKERTRGRVPLQ
jgi:tetratricopeptide (TPR) repeat protein